MLELFPDGDPQAAAGTVSMQESQTRPGYYIGVSDDGLSGWHDFVGTDATGRVRCDGRVKLLNAGGVVRAGRDPDVDSYLESRSQAGSRAAAIQYFETDTRLAGGYSWVKYQELVTAACVGKAVTNEGGTETFRNLADVAVFTTTFDSENGDRITVDIH